MRSFEKCVAIFAVLLIFSVVGCGGDSDDSERGGAAIDSEEWDTLSQHEKNQKILERAIVDLNVDVRLSCKNWIRKVVTDASNGYVTMPRNNERGDGWQEDSTGRISGWGAAFYSSTHILTAFPGAIVQMQWKEEFGSSEPDYKRHTAIVLYVSGSHVIFIESNYDNTPRVEDGPTFVKIRSESAEEFHKKVESFTIYYIG